MTNYSKLALEGDLQLFTDVNMRLFVEKCIQDFPDYFWTAPASGSGKYHPDDENGTGGLVLHTRRVIRTVLLLAELHNLNWSERDILLAAAFLHDSWCKGLQPKTRNGNTDIYHPLYVRSKFPLTPYGDQWIQTSQYNMVMECVEAHSGRYSVSPLLDSDKKLSRIFQTADYIASRKGITIDLDVLKKNIKNPPQ